MPTASLIPPLCRSFQRHFSEIGTSITTADWICDAAKVSFGSNKTQGAERFLIADDGLGEFRGLQKDLGHDHHTSLEFGLDELQLVVGGSVYSRKIGGAEHQYRDPNIGERGVVAGAASDPLAHLKFDSNSLGKFQRQIDILLVPQDTQR